MLHFLRMSVAIRLPNIVVCTCGASMNDVTASSQIAAYQHHIGLRRVRILSARVRYPRVRRRQWHPNIQLAVHDVIPYPDRLACRPVDGLPYLPDFLIDLCWLATIED